jgi:hypothetical protein
MADASFDFYQVPHWKALLEAQARDARLREWLVEEWGWSTSWVCSLDPDDADCLRIAAGLVPRGPAHQERLREQERRRQATLTALHRATNGDAGAWAQATGDGRREVGEAAFSYLTVRCLPEQAVRDIVEENRLSGHAFATVAALQVLGSMDQQRLRILPAERWQEWFAAVLWFARMTCDDALTRVIAAAWDASPHAVRSTVLGRARHDDYPPLDAIEPHWDSELSALLLAYLEQAGATAPSLGAILPRLLRRGVAGARALAESLLDGHGSAVRGEVAASVAAAQALLTSLGADAWPRIEPILGADPLWGVQVLVGQRGWDKTLQLGRSLSDMQLTNIVGWAIERFPPERDASGTRVGPPVEYMRDQLVHLLKARGTDEACAGLRSLERRFPQYDWLRQVRRDAEDIREQASWIPIRPEHLLRMAAGRALRRIESGEQLLALLAESLERLERDLHGTTPAVPDLWDRQHDAQAWRPKDEAAFSNWVARALRRDLPGAVVNREVEIRDGMSMGGRAGQRTDILVELGGAPRLSVVIEVKGSWHREIAEAMESQLVDRYLRDNQSRHGVYLVGWFHCEAWKDGQPARFETLESCRSHLEGQAAALSERRSRPVHVRAVVLDCRISRLDPGAVRDTPGVRTQLASAAPRVGKAKARTATNGRSDTGARRRARPWRPR